MSKKSRYEYLLTIRERYIQSDKEGKNKILNEFCKICRYNRKYAIRILNKDPVKGKRSNKKRCGPKPKYDNPNLIEFLRTIWKSTNLICSKRLKEAIPLWISWYIKPDGNRLSKEEELLLLEISPASIDRHISKYRKKFNKKGLCTTKPGSIIKDYLPIKTEQWDESRPGFLEADTVAHCGGNIAGEYVFTLNTVDIATGWRSLQALWGKGETGVMIAMRKIEQTLPFKILGFDTDNGNEFLNWRLIKYFKGRKKPVEFSRSRPYKKNDNAHIEEKNWTIVRQYIGYDRLEKREMVDMLNNLYETEFNYLINYFLPSVKLTAKIRIGSKIKKKYSEPKTPFQRLIETKTIPRRTEQILTGVFKLLNPFELKKAVEKKIDRILKLTVK